ncbi:MAG: hypothetical protein HFH38_14410 [Lachnospiraceae bacterium]|nr:hypothetical protein [Lachnospiraceae bacterium]
MAAGSIQGIAGNGYFTANMLYSAGTKRDGEGSGAFAGEQWDHLWGQVGSSTGEGQEDIASCREEAQKQQGQEAWQAWFGCIAAQGGHSRSMCFGQTEAEGETITVDTAPQPVSDAAIQKICGKYGGAPYSALADSNGMIESNGVVFQCDYENNRLCLGDVSDPGKCITIPLENGGCLMVNRDNIDDLAKGIGMFSPADINRILRAISQDAKLRQMQYEIEEEFSGTGLLDAEKRVGYGFEE